ncbi:hypothetical protein I3843_09G021900 [Carya illinoinensis]|uniref:Uncharacterized protein n=1 Tax=Carya illinoinensis TaxID=32201 RepID=A0A922E1C1_CARIL|nr:hypothetical protein I3760_09G021400 [Carya illinoinensis]KAG6693842.1 hypothetical protein I3842_09G021700 [Carya illinoinensis]KAG7961531.1 hypothetical protein I3843_09G021900 [Carya illinoinensis]
MNSLFSGSSSGEQASAEYHLVNLDKLMDDVKSVTDKLNELDGLDQDVPSGPDHAKAFKDLQSRMINAADVALALQKAKLIKVTLETKLIKDQHDRLNRLNGSFFPILIVTSVLALMIILIAQAFY